MKRSLVLLGTLLACPLFGAVSKANFSAKVDRLEAQFPNQLKVFVGIEDDEGAFPIGVVQVRGQRPSLVPGGVYLIEGSFYAPIPSELVLTEPDGTVAKQVAVPAGSADFAVPVKVTEKGPLHLYCRSRNGKWTYGAVYVSSTLPHWWSRHYAGAGVYYGSHEVISTGTTRVAGVAANLGWPNYSGPADSAESVANNFTPFGPAGLAYAPVNTCTVATPSGKK